MKRFLNLTALAVSIIAASCGSTATTDNAHDTVATGEEVTPGQRLDTLISDTRASADKAADKMEATADRTEEGISNAYDKTKEGVTEAGRDIKDAAHDAKEKIKEGTAKAAEKVEQKSKEVKEDMRK